MKRYVVLIAICFLHCSCAKKDLIAPINFKVDSRESKDSKESGQLDLVVASENSVHVEDPKSKELAGDKGVLVLPPVVLGRIWTSTDGRTIDAVLLSRTIDSIKIRRCVDQSEFTIPLSKVCEADRNYVLNSRLPLPISQNQIDVLVKNFPKAPSLSNGEVTNDLKQLHEKYLSLAKFIRPGTIRPNMVMIRNKIDADIKVFNEISKTSLGDGSGRRNSGQSAGAENGILSARRSLSWLQGAVTDYMKSFDALQGQ